MRKRTTRSTQGFTLIELMIVVVIVGILAAIAYPSYINHITTSRRAAAEACLSSYSSYMERFYATNMRYDQDSSAAHNPPTSPSNMDCASPQNTGANYVYSTVLAQSTYSLAATPQNSQASRDTKCAILSVNQTGQRGQTGTGTEAQCWGQ